MLRKISKWSRIQDSFRITPKIESLVVFPIPDIPWKCQNDPSITVWVILLTNRQTNSGKNITSLAEVNITLHTVNRDIFLIFGNFLQFPRWRHQIAVTWIRFSKSSHLVESLHLHHLEKRHFGSFSTCVTLFKVFKGAKPKSRWPQAGSRVQRRAMRHAACVVARACCQWVLQQFLW